MADLVRVDRLGDINFGLPEDLAPHKKPWEYYRILGVDRKATSEEIRRAFGEASKQVHPDRYREGTPEWGEATEKQKLLGMIRGILLDDDSEIGKMWSRRSLYNKVSGYAEFFGDAHIKHRGERTKTMPEELFDVCELEKKCKEGEHRFEKENPDIARCITRMEKACDDGDYRRAEELRKEVVRKLGEKQGVPLDEFVKQQEAAKREYERRKERRQKEQEEVGTQIRAALEAAPRDRNDKRKLKVFEIWYNGKKGSDENRVSFNTDSRTEFRLVGGKENKGIIKIGMSGPATLSSMRQVHFKAQYADVTVTDAYMEGIIQIVEGKVIINYEGSSYGSVIRARTKNKAGVSASGDFVREGDLYIPKDFAVEGWAEKAPALDVAVLKGEIDLRMKRRMVQEGRADYNLGMYGDIYSKISGLSDIISKNYIKSYYYKNLKDFI